MQKLVTPKLALVSVSDKTGIVDFCKELNQKHGVKIISTGGTYKLLVESGVEAVEISKYTNSPEIMDGRVKTLHPKIHAGLLCDIDKQEHLDGMKLVEAEKIDIVVVNLYPFYKTVQSGASEEDIIENIDIGGPSMLRSAAKNFKHTAVITDVEDYNTYLQNLSENNGSSTLNLRYNFCKKTFLHTAYYDAIISTHLCKDDDFFEKSNIAIPLQISQHLRYGENPQQKANFYTVPLASSPLSNFTQLGGKELSYNNINDSLSAIESVTAFTSINNLKKAVCIVKHNNPCCFGFAASELEAYTNAITNGDSLSAFGGIVAINGAINEVLAGELVKIFYEVIICFDITEAAKQILQTKKNLRVLVLKQNIKSNSIINNLKIKISSGAALVQANDNFVVSKSDINIVSGAAGLEQMDEFLFAILLVKYLSSNAICITYKNSLIAVGCGQTSRVDAVKIACQKAEEKCKILGINPANLTLASDAFFPFADNIDAIASYGIVNVIVPSGSIKDGEVIEAAKQKNLNLAFVPNRFFRH